MQKFSYTLFALLFAISAISCTNNRFQLIGKVPFEFDGETVWLISYNRENNEVVRKDSTIIQNGEFRFEGIEHLSGVSRLHFEDGPWPFVILESGTINLNIREEFFVGGTPQNDIWQSYFDSLMWNHPFVYELIVENQSKLVSKMIFDHFAYSLPTDRFETLYSKLNENFRNHPLVISTTEGNKRFNNEIQKRNALIGTTIPDISLLNIMGENVKLSQFLGKSEYVYLNFWASWCSPCIGKLPYLKAVREKHSENQLKIIGISTDRRKEDWLNALNTNNITTAWTQLIAPEYSRIQIWEDLFVSLIPDGMLLNRKGEILRVQMWITEIDDFFESH